MAVSNRPWSSFSEADYTPEQFCRAALLDLNEAGAEKSKGQCKLPIREPDGTLNRNGVHAAAGALAGARTPLQAPPDQKRAAARKLMAAYRELDEEPPETVRRLAR